MQILWSLYINTTSDVKFSLYLQKAGLAVRNIVHLNLKSSIFVLVLLAVFFIIISFGSSSDKGTEKVNEKVSTLSQFIKLDSQIVP